MIETDLVPLDLTLVNQKLFRIDTGAWINAQENPSAVTYEDVFRYVAETVAEEFPGFEYRTVGSKNLPAIVYPHVHSLDWDIHLICVFSNVDNDKNLLDPFANSTITANSIVSSGSIYPSLVVYDFTNDTMISYGLSGTSTRGARYGSIYYSDDTSSTATRRMILLNEKLNFKIIKYADMYFATAFFGSFSTYTYKVVQPTLIFTSVLREHDNLEIPALLSYLGYFLNIQPLNQSFKHDYNGSFSAPGFFNYNNSTYIKTVAQLIFDSSDAERFYSKSIFVSWDSNATLVTSNMDIDTDILGETETVIDNKKFVFVPVYSAFSSDTKALVGFLSQ